MKDINKALMKAAKSGDETKLQALLLRPGCDSMFKDGGGCTALMWAACGGRFSCTKLLVPVSDALAKNNDGKTASKMNRDSGHTSLAAFIDAYTLALSEVLGMGSSIPLGAPRRDPSLRV